MGMFDNYTPNEYRTINSYGTVVDNIPVPVEPIPLTCEISGIDSVYNIEGIKTAYRFDSGDNVSIILTISGDDAESIVAAKSAVVSFYNFRFERLFSINFDTASQQMTVVIDKETSREVFVPGIYYMDLILEDNITHKTIMATEKYKIVVGNVIVTKEQ